VAPPRALPGHGRQQLMTAGHRRFAGVHQHEAARPIGVLGHAWRKAGLPEQGGLLVSCQPGDGHGRTQQGRLGLAQHPAGRHDLGQHGGRDVEQAQQGRVPAQSLQVEQQGARGVAGIGGMDPPARQLPDQPAVHGAEGQFAPVGARPCARHLVQQPRELCGREIGVGQQAGPFLDPSGLALGAKRRADAGCAPVLPDDGRRHGFTRPPVPQHRGFSLIRDPDGGHLTGTNPLPGQHVLHHAELGLPDLGRVMLHPARLGKRLPELPLRRGHDVPVAVEQNGA
jgi:hypothetical protein